MRDGVQQQQGFEGVVVVAEGENVGPFLSNSLSCSEGWFWGNGVGVENPSSTEFFWVKCGKSMGYGEFGRASRGWTEYANLAIGFQVRNKIPSSQ